jgi:hypothetical protein
MVGIILPPALSLRQIDHTGNVTLSTAERQTKRLLDKQPKAGENMRCSIIGNFAEFGAPPEIKAISGRSNETARNR